jgi:hypothetical protein
MTLERTKVLVLSSITCFQRLAAEKSSAALRLHYCSLRHDLDRLKTMNTIYYYQFQWLKTSMGSLEIPTHPMARDQPRNHRQCHIRTRLRKLRAKIPEMCVKLVGAVRRNSSLKGYKSYLLVHMVVNTVFVMVMAKGKFTYEQSGGRATRHLLWS